MFFLTYTHFILSIRSLEKNTLRPSDNVSQIPHQVAEALLAPPPHYERYRLFFVGGQHFFTLRLASYSKLWFAARYAPYEV